MYNKERAVPIYVEIAESIRRRAASGELKPGDQLPTVRVAAKMWNCTPGTVSRAYQLLAQEGLVRGKRGGGTTITAGLLTRQHDAPLTWGTLVNRAEHFLLESLAAGHSPAQVQSALSVATMRWQEMQTGKAEAEGKKGQPGRTVSSFRFAGSNDLVVEMLPSLLRERAPEYNLNLKYTGSLGGLIALSLGEAEIAGAHLWDESTDEYNLPFVRRVLPGRRVCLLTLAHRDVGLILPPGNPKMVHSLEDLTQPGLRFVNRQPGSGIRVWLDSQPGSSDREKRTSLPDETTHLGVGRAVAEGKADAGVGIFAAAAAYDLAFIPLTQEHYELVLPEETRNHPIMESLVGLLRSPDLREVFESLGGYDTSKTGSERWAG